MSLDLKLLPLAKNHMSGRSDVEFSHNVIEFGSNLEIYGKLEKFVRANGVPVAKEFSSYLGRVPDGSHEGECGYGVVTKDPYGEPLKMLTVAQFLNFLEKEQVDFSNLERARAARAFLRELPPERYVVFYWS